MTRKNLINAVSEQLINKKHENIMVYFADSKVTITWSDDDQEFCIEGFRANNFVDGYWDFSSCANLKHWIADLKKSDLEKYLSCPNKFHIVLDEVEV